MRVVFSLVLYKHKLDDIRPLLDSLCLQLTSLPFALSLHVYNSTPSFIHIDQVTKFAPGLDVFYQNGPNVGFGAANNVNFASARLGVDDLFVICNPDIYFDWDSLLPLINWIALQSDVSCCAPLILNSVDTVQFSAKKNPTFLSLFLGRFSFLTLVPVLRDYMYLHCNKQCNYLDTCVPSSYLSGCFLLVPACFYYRVNGFSESFFLHLEDADLVRSLSLCGRTLHNPLGTVHHTWSRGSHRSIVQMFHLLRSMYVYFRKWGFSLY